MNMCRQYTYEQRVHIIYLTMNNIYIPSTQLKTICIDYRPFKSTTGTILFTRHSEERDMS